MTFLSLLIRIVSAVLRWVMHVSQCNQSTGPFTFIPSLVPCDLLVLNGHACRQLRAFKFDQLGYILTIQCKSIILSSLLCSLQNRKKKRGVKTWSREKEPDWISEVLNCVNKTGLGRDAKTGALRHLSCLLGAEMKNLLQKKMVIKSDVMSSGSLLKEERIMLN